MPFAFRGWFVNKHEDTILALIAGYVDTVGFVALFGLFTAHVTGNFVLIGAGVAGVGQGVLLKLLAFPSFVVGIALSSVIFKFLERNHSADAASALYLLQAMLLVSFLVTGLIATPIEAPNASMVLVCGVLGTMAMGVQNARGRLLQVTGLPNTVMTGNVTQIVLDVIELIHRGAAGGHGQQVRGRPQLDVGGNVRLCRRRDRRRAGIRQFFVSRDCIAGSRFAVSCLEEKGDGGRKRIACREYIASKAPARHQTWPRTEVGRSNIANTHG
ncbi:YoaK family protein [Paraburkholderia sediminicola]